MKAIMVMFDSLNRHMLPPYGCDWVQAPNFQRLADHAVTFDNAYVGSMPCIPARRELHTGRYNFLHRSWGPLEPFDDSMPQILHENGVYTHLVTDHRHYFEDGGVGYHTRYSSWEYFRGQEGDLWKGQVTDPEMPQDLHGRRGDRFYRQHFVNQQYFTDEAAFPQARTFAAGLDFIRTNHNEDNWFLQIETFDPHEPFLTPPGYKERYPDEYEGPAFDWPQYRPVDETPEAIAHIRNQYAALVTMCDTYLGKVLDEMDRLDLWRDIMLIVNTDHGFLLSEHDWWGKVTMPFYNEIARIPLFIWDPRAGKAGERREQLVQTIDLAPTLLEFFGVTRPKDMQGVPLGPVIAENGPTRAAALFGMFGAHVNVTDGRFIYMRAPVDLEHPYYYYTLLPAHMLEYFAVEDLRAVRLAEPFAFTKGVPLLAVPVAAADDRARIMLEAAGGGLPPLAHHLFDLEAAPQQETELDDPAVAAEMLAHLTRLMGGNHAPGELYARLGLTPF
jgi:arylsulfatase A-like enzyme